MNGRTRCPDCFTPRPTNSCCPDCRASRELVSRILRDDLRDVRLPNPQAEEAHAREQLHRQRVRRLNSLYWQRRSR